MLERISRASFARSKRKVDIALSKAADLTPTDSSASDSSRTQKFIISTEAVDRDGDTLALDGWDLADYKKNPIVLFDHDARSPIGKSLSIYTEDDALKAVAWFAEKGQSELAETVFQLVKADILNTASVTFLPLEFTQANDRTSGSMWGLPPMNFKRQKLLEWSVVSVPSNQEALKQNKSNKQIDWRTYGQWVERALDGDTAGPLPAPRAEYEKTYAVVKSILGGTPRAKAPAGATEILPMDPTSKAGKVLSKENLTRLKAAVEHAESASDLHSKAAAHFDKCAEHMKAVMDGADKDGDGDDDDAGGKTAPAGTSKTTSEPVGTQSKSGDSAGTSASTPAPAASSAATDAELIARARKAIQETATPVEDEPAPYTQEEIAAAMHTVIDEIHTQHIRELRGQD